MSDLSKSHRPKVFFSSFFSHKLCGGVLRITYSKCMQFHACVTVFLWNMSFNSSIIEKYWYGQFKRYIDGPSGQERHLGSIFMIIITYQSIGVEKAVFGEFFQGSRQMLLNTLVRTGARKLLGITLGPGKQFCDESDQSCTASLSFIFCERKQIK